MAAEVEKHNVHGTAGEPIDLPLPQGPVTGHSWTLDLPEGVERIDDGPPKRVDPPARPGATVQGAIRVKARRGEYRITAKLARSWQPDDPAKIVEITLKVD